MYAYGTSKSNETENHGIHITHPFDLPSLDSVLEHWRKQSMISCKSSWSPPSQSHSLKSFMLVLISSRILSMRAMYPCFVLDKDIAEFSNSTAVLKMISFLQQISKHMGYIVKQTTTYLIISTGIRS